MKREITVEFQIDEVKAIDISRRLLDQFCQQKGFFKEYSMPEYILPSNLEKGSREHALYLTYVISIDYMTNAEKLWRNARDNFTMYPDRFLPESILQISDRTLRAFLRGLGARFSTTAVSTWKSISRLLIDLYDSDPRKITTSQSTINEIKQKLDAFPYLRGSKLSNFYIRVMGETELFQISNLGDLDIPVDIQVARFTIYTGVLQLVSERYEGCVHEPPLRNLIEDAWKTAAQKVDSHAWKLDEPIWTIGSKLCTKRNCHICPVTDLCDKVKGVQFRDGIAIWKSI